MPASAALSHEKVCHACGQHVKSDQPSVKVHGLPFHAHCAGYTRRSAA